MKFPHNVRWKRREETMGIRFTVAVALVAVSVLLGATPGNADNGMTVRVTESPVVSQPPAFSSSGTTVVAPRTRIIVNQGSGRRSAVMVEDNSLKEMAARINELRIRPRDMAGYLLALKRAGYLQGEVIAR